jgi:hypothetical protein
MALFKLALNGITIETIQNTRMITNEDETDQMNILIMKKTVISKFILKKYGINHNTFNVTLIILFLCLITSNASSLLRW